jgi:hypothetical protein
MKERKRMTIKAEGRAENEREKAYDHKSRGGEQRMKERKCMTIRAEGRAENVRKNAYDHKKIGESRE